MAAELWQQRRASRPPADLEAPTVFQFPGLAQVSVETVVSSADAEQFYGFYLEAFGPLRTLAVARQVLHRDEFLEQMVDPRVWKLVAWDRHGRASGLTTLTRDLSTVPWISPEYFADRFPEHTRRNAVYYWGFTVTRPEQRRKRLFLAMLSAAAEVVAADKGVCGYDICAFNNASMHLADEIEQLSHHLAAVTFDVIDTQTYYCATLL